VIVSHFRSKKSSNYEAHKAYKVPSVIKIRLKSWMKTVKFGWWN